MAVRRPKAPKKSKDRVLRSAAVEGLEWIELPLSEVHVRPGWSIRGAPTDEEIAQWRETFATVPMAHPPSVAQVDGVWQVIAGEKRFHVWVAEGRAEGVFRLVRGSEDDLLLYNLSDAVAYTPPRGHELVERVAMLRERGVQTKTIAAACRVGPRYIRSLVAIKKHAHPELWEAFCAEHPHLSISRMADLAAHPLEEQPKRFRRLARHQRRADETARGYSEELEESDDELRARRRYPSRRAAERLEALLTGEPSLPDGYREGALDVLKWFLYEADLSQRFAWSTLARAQELAQQRDRESMT